MAGFGTGWPLNGVQVISGIDIAHLVTPLFYRRAAGEAAPRESQTCHCKVLAKKL